MRAMVLVPVMMAALMAPAFGQTATADWGDVPTPPNATVRLDHDAQGNETRRIDYPGGVVAQQVRRGGKVQTLVEDRSGHGAVLCLRMIYLGLREGLDVCRQEGDGPARAFMDEALDQLDDFVVANSLRPVTKDSLKMDEAQRLKKVQAEAARRGPEAVAKGCASGDALRMLGGVRKASLDGLRSDLAAALSVPRPPVMNPCL
ncbi:hypothetical protein [Nitrospirillum iridis]|uniref:Secreted protein n=1 Tax=Nitrospirillum iridis TaxID=765888 RepID=A0A7X0AZD7_9PROT|nr:hypothetical protein [Nitrospirillum iridis]MBB6251481.1 hypothetical protein [Nitrospirillum iridis]